MAGILLQQLVPPIIVILMALLLAILIFLKIKSHKLHFLYFTFPIIFIAGFLLMRADISRYNVSSKEDFEISGMVYKAGKTDYGYKIYVRRNFFDHERVICYVDEKIQVGCYVQIKGSAQAYSYPTNPGEFNSKNYYNSQKIIYKIKADSVFLTGKKDYIYYYAGTLGDYFEKIFYEIADDKYASVYSAMLLGRKDELDEDISDIFSSSGIGHILAISGLHISLIGMGLYKMLKKAGAGYVSAMIVSVVFILFYGILTGNGISTVRALTMFCVAVYAGVAGRTYDIISAASLAGIIALLDSPLLIYNAGFLLSYMAIVGIGFVIRAVESVTTFKSKITKSFIASFSIQMATLPVILYYYFTVPLLSLFLNIIVIPLMTVVMISGIAGLICGLISVNMGTFAIGPGVYILKLYELLCGINSKIPFSNYTAGRQKIIFIAIYYGILIVFLILCEKYKSKKTLLILPALLVFILVRKNRGFEMIFMDVGQGDGIFIRGDGGATFLIDGGSTDKSSLYKYTLKQVILAAGTDTIDYAIVTHCDNDHISGLKELIEDDKITIKTLYMPSTTLIDDAYTELVNLAENDGISVKYIYEGMHISDGSTYISCLHPEYNYETTERNDYSTTLLVENNDFSALLTGDISSEQEELILSKYDFEDGITLLKSAHHGSRYSNCLDFYEKLTPNYTIISCGVDNSYGHPHEEALENMEKVNSIIYRTDEDGAVIVDYKGNVGVK